MGSEEDKIELFMKAQVDVNKEHLEKLEKLEKELDEMRERDMEFQSLIASHIKKLEEVLKQLAGGIQFKWMKTRFDYIGYINNIIEQLKSGGTVNSRVFDIPDSDIKRQMEQYKKENPNDFKEGTEVRKTPCLIWESGLTEQEADTFCSEHIARYNTCDGCKYQIPKNKEGTEDAEESPAGIAELERLYDSPPHDEDNKLPTIEEAEKDAKELINKYKPSYGVCYIDAMDIPDLIKEVRDKQRRELITEFIEKINTENHEDGYDTPWYEIDDLITEYDKLLEEAKEK